jgi:Leucine-rich repeat (LRR) protein/subtilisin family serine protease
VGAAAGPVLGEGFVLAGERVASGVVWLDWGDVEDAAGYELMFRGTDGWGLLSQDEPAGGAAAVLEGSSARVAGLPVDVGEYWFAVRARNAFGVSLWSDSAEVAVPEYALEAPRAEPLFDPFTAPTLSGIDLERLREAVADIAPGEADCSAVPALSVDGITVVDAPAGLDDPDAPLTVTEVARVAGGCLLVEYVALEGRSVAQVRALLAGDDGVHAVGEPIRGLRAEHDSAGNDDDSAHHDDGAGAQWHLTAGVTGLWAGWQPDSPVTVAVLDTGVDTRHPDLDDNVAAASAGGCHEVDATGHGTHVAGIVAAEHHDSPVTNQHVAGVAPHAAILPLRVLERDTCMLSPAPVTPPVAVAQAVNEGARVINMSLSGNARHDTEDLVAGGIAIPSTDTYELVLRAASMLGVVTIAAAGNCGDDADTDNDGIPNWQDKERPCSEHNAKMRPALYPDAIAVAAINHDSTRSSFSTANEHVDIAAPGQGILSTDRCTYGGNPVSPVLECETAEYQGTSMAAPFVAGVVAHMLNRYAEATVEQVRDALFRSARRDLPIDHPNHDYGFGIVDPKEALSKLGEIVAEPEVPDAGGFEEVYAGAQHSCGRRASGRVRCWGGNGVAADTPGLAFDQVSVPTGPAHHACGINISSLEPSGARYGTALCWSATGAGVPRVVKGTLKRVVTGFAVTCGLRPDDSVVCWDNDTGADRYERDLQGETLKEISGGWLHFCGRRDNNTVLCWGENTVGQSDAPAGVKFLAVDAGGGHSCGVTVAGAVRCWGETGAMAGVPAATQRGFVAVNAGHGHACGVRQAGPAPNFNADGGRVVCWGSSTHGQADAPEAAFTQVSAGWRHSCGRRPDATVVCWGDNTFGQAAQARLETLSLTRGNTGLFAFDPAVTDYTVIAEPGEATLAYTVAEAGEAALTAEPSLRDAKPDDPLDPTSIGHQVMLADGLVIEVAVRALFGFGESRTYRINVVEPPRLASLQVISGVPGPHCRPTCPRLALSPAFDSGVFDYTVAAPEDLGLLSVSWSASGAAAVVAPADADAAGGHQVALNTNAGFVAVDAGGNFSCGLKSSGRVECWGDNDHGQLDAPAGVFSAVSAGTRHACAIGAGATVSCWGWNIDGQLDAPAGAFDAVTAGGFHTCGLQPGGSGRCWGFDSDGEATAPAGSFKQVAAGAFHTCWIDTSDRVSCRGWDLFDSIDAPAGAFDAVSAGTFFACGLRPPNSTLTCWGTNDSGQSRPPSGTFSAVSAGVVHACGLNAAAAAVCWGGNTAGQSRALSGTFSAVSAGGGHSCGLRPAGTVDCWGSPPGRLKVAAPAEITVTVTSRTDPSVAAVYTVSVSRTAPVSAQQSHTPLSAAAGESEAVDTAACDGDPRCETVLADTSGLAGAAPGAPAPVTAPTQPETSHARSARHNPPGGNGAPANAASPHRGRAAVPQTVACPTSSADTAAAVEIADGVLRAEIERQLDKIPGAAITAAEMAGLTSLSLPAPASRGGEAVSSLAGLQHATGLTTLSLPGHGLTSLQPLSCLSALAILDASNNQISDISALPAHRALAALDLSGNDITTLAALSGLTSLTTLNVGANRISSLAPLSSLTGLQALYAYRNDIASLSAVSPLAALKVLDLSHNDISDISALAALSGLTRLGLGDNNITDISALGGLAGLETLYLFDNDITDASALAGLGGLRVLWIDGNALTSPYRLPRLGAPGYLDVRHNLISDVAPLDAAAAPEATVHREPQRVATVHISDPGLRAALLAATGRAPDEALDAGEVAAIERLNMIDIELGDLSELRALGSLRWLNLHQNSLNSLDDLPALDRLETLFVDFNNIADLAALTGRRGLSALGLVGNNITDISALAPLSGLEALYLSDNNIADISALAGLRSLHHLRLTTNNVADLEPLKGLTGLTQLHLRHNDVTSLEPLKGLTGLIHLDLRDNDITSLEPLKELTNLRDLHIGGNHITDLTPLDHLSGLTIHGHNHQTPTN